MEKTTTRQNGTAEGDLELHSLSTTTVEPPAPQDAPPQPETPRPGRGGLIAVVAILFVALSFAAWLVSRDSGTDVAPSLREEPVASVPAYTGDWKDIHIGRATSGSTYTGDWKDIHVGAPNSRSVYTGDWKDSYLGR